MGQIQVAPRLKTDLSRSRIVFEDQWNSRPSRQIKRFTGSASDRKFLLNCSHCQDQKKLFFGTFHIADFIQDLSGVNLQNATRPISTTGEVSINP